MVNTDAQNRQQHRLEIQMSIAEILDIEVKELIISNKKDSEYNKNDIQYYFTPSKPNP